MQHLWILITSVLIDLIAQYSLLLSIAFSLVSIIDISIINLLGGLVFWTGPSVNF
jgi:hypothetical protein